MKNKQRKHKASFPGGNLYWLCHYALTIIFQQTRNLQVIVTSNLTVNFCCLSNWIVNWFFQAFQFPFFFRCSTPQVTAQINHLIIIQESQIPNNTVYEKPSTSQQVEKTNKRAMHTKPLQFLWHVGSRTCEHGIKESSFFNTFSFASHEEQPKTNAVWYFKDQQTQCVWKVDLSWFF